MFSGHLIDNEAYEEPEMTISCLARWCAVHSTRKTIKRCAAVPPLKRNITKKCVPCTRHCSREQSAEQRGEFPFKWGSHAFGEEER